MKDLKPIIAKNISELRTAAGMTQIELAEKLNYSDKAVSKWERGESVPDVSVLLSVAELFGVTLDYLVHEHEAVKPLNELRHDRVRNRGLITGLAVVLVWLIATAAFVSTDIASVEFSYRWLSFLWAAPASLIVWLVFNSVWFNKSVNFAIISLLTWSTLAAVYLTLLLAAKLNLWILFVLGVPGQIIIFMWSGIKVRKRKKEI